MTLALLDEPEGGSLNELVWSDTSVTKTYGTKPDQTIDRGHEVLRRQYLYLTALGERAAKRFPPVLSYIDRRDPHVTELTVARLPQRAIAKAILLREHDSARTAALCGHALDILMTDLYPLRERHLSAAYVWERHHRLRLRAALLGLRRIPEIAPLIEAQGVTVNGVDRPSAATCVKWLRKHWRHYFCDSTAVAAHGDAHLDNILGSSSGPLSIYYIDPRGDEHLEPSYDFAKMLKAARCYYDMIHYGYRELRFDGAALRLDLKVDHQWDDHYRAVLEVLHERAPIFAETQRLPVREFWKMALATELVHVISFASYHANRPRNRDLDRVVAFLGVASLLGHALMTAGPAQLPDISRPIL